MTDGKFIMAAGGWPIRVNGVTIGGIGISGGNAPGRDDEIARAGLSILAPAPQQVPVYTQPQTVADQAASTPVQGYSNGSAEYPAPVPTPDNNLYSDSTEHTTGTNYLSNEERNESTLRGKPPSSNANLQENSGDEQ